MTGSLLCDRQFGVLRLSVRRQLVLAGIALLSALITAVAIANGPVRYEGRADVFLSKLFPGRSGFDMDPFAATFQSSLTLPEVTNAVSGLTGVPPGEIARGISSARPSQGTIVAVLFKGSSRDLDTVARVPREVALAGLRNLVQQDWVQLDTQLQQALAALQTVRNEVTAFEESIGFANLDGELEAQRQRLAALRAAQAGATPEAAAVQRRIVELGSLRSQRDVFLSRQARSEQDVVEAESNLRTAAARLASIETPGLVTDGSAWVMPMTSAITRGAVSALLVSALATLGLFVLADKRAVRRRTQLRPERIDSVRTPGHVGNGEAVRYAPAAPAPNAIQARNGDHGGDRRDLESWPVAEDVEDGAFSRSRAAEEAQRAVPFKLG